MFVLNPKEGTDYWSLQLARTNCPYTPLETERKREPQGETERKRNREGETERK